jgi:hypothetical protein
MAPFLLFACVTARAVIAASALGLMALTTDASATLLTFDALPEVAPPLPDVDHEYDERGYTFTLFGGDESPLFWHLGDGTGVPGTLNWHGTPAGFNSKLKIRLTKQDGRPFDLLQLDLDFLSASGEPVILTIFAAGYGERMFGVTPEQPGLISIANQPLDFFGVSEVVFRHVQGRGVGFDNVRVIAIPEPGGLCLLVIGLAGLTFTRRWTNTTV